MNSAFLANLTSPPLLFFFLGCIAALLRSDLDVPNPVAKALSLYLLFAIGFKGGVALSESELTVTIVGALLAALALASLVPVYIYFLVRRLVPNHDAAAIAATYGSISAVTFVTAVNYLNSQAIDWGGHFVAAMALMEAPAIVVGLFLYQRSRGGITPDAPGDDTSVGGLLREALVNGSVILILGALVIGAISGPRGMEQLEPFVKTPFVGVLCLFLLDMGLVAARRLEDVLRPREPDQGGPSALALSALAVLFALLNGSLGLGLATLLGLPEGDALLLTMLGASASYIAVPAAMRLALPEANPSIYLTMSLAITFPFNILIGIPMFHELVKLVAA